MKLVKKYNSNFTTLSNEILQSKELTLKSKGLYAYMMSLPNDWNFSISGIETQIKEGKTAIRNSLLELEEVGLLFRKRERDANGQLKNVEYWIYSEFSPKSDFPTLEKPTLENRTQTKEINNKRNINKNTKEKKSIKKENIYRVLSSNKNLVLTESEFLKLSAQYTKEQIDNILDAIDNYKKNKNYNFLYMTCIKWLKKEKNFAPKKEKSGLLADRILADMMPVQENETIDVDYN